MPRVFRASQRRDHPNVTLIEAKRSSPRSRGYDSKWDRYSRAYRRKHPFCALCLEKGRMTLIVAGATGVVDHKLPVRHGGAFWDGANHWSLCVAHHGLKAKWEKHAEETGQIDQLIRWCDDPESRPRFRGDL